MKKLGTTLLFFAIAIQGQEGNVGINTENPVVTLEVAGVPSNTQKADGFLPPRLTGDELFAKSGAYNTEHKGVVVYITKSASEENQKDKTQRVNNEGYYYYDGNIWVKMQSEASLDYELKDVGTIFATKPVYAPYSGDKDNNTRITPLEVVKKIVVPAGEKYEVLLDYSVPAGIKITPDTYFIRLAEGDSLELEGDSLELEGGSLELVKRFSAYIGARLLKNNKEIKGASRKFVVPMVSVPAEMPMLTISSSYSEVLDNTAGTKDMVVEYSLNGYLEVYPNLTNSPAVMNETDEEIVVYNMYSTDDDFNYNWGKTSLRYQVYKVNK